MNNYRVLPPHLHTVADAAETLIRLKYGLSQTRIETAISSEIGLEPTLHWKTPLGYIICEVSEKPLPVSILTAYSEIIASGLPIKVIIAYPSSLTITQAEYLKESNKAKKFGLGLLSVNDDGTGNFEHTGIDLSLYLPSPEMASYHQAFRAEINKAFDLYINGDPVHGVQAVGQLVEDTLVNVAHQAKKKGLLISGGFRSKEAYYPSAKLIDDFIADRILDNIILGRCRGFIDDRNKTSHKPKNLLQAQKLHKALKNSMLDGLRIIENLPKSLKDKTYRVR